MVHPQIYGIKARLHEPVKLHGFLRGLQVCQQDTVVYEFLLSQVEETIQESLTGTESADVYISTPGLLKNPVQETERMKSSTQIALRGALIQWLEYRRYVPAPAHLNQKSRV